MFKKAYIFSNHKQKSNEIYDILEQNLRSLGFELLSEYDESADILFCIGGDGTFLSFVHKYNFPVAPILGINTGHLGFFQEVTQNNLKQILDNIVSGDIKYQSLYPIIANIKTTNNEFTRYGINEIVVRGNFSHVSQYSVSIEDQVIQNFSGDGLLVSTPAGSTAYNYSLGGALVAQDLDVLQITPVAPMNTNAYRCFHSSILLPANKAITIEGIGRSTNGYIILSFDGRTHEFQDVVKTTITKSDKEIRIIRSNTYNYWAKLSSKLV